MAIWNADGIVVVRSKGQITVTATINKDGVKVEDYSGPDNLSDVSQVVPTVYARLKQLGDADTYDASKIGTITYDPDAIAAGPTPEDLAQQAFLSALQTYIGMQLMVKLGVLAADDKTVTQQLQTLTGAFDPTYLPLIARFNF